MRQKLYSKLLPVAIAMAVFSQSGLYAQVTIGSDLVPNTGAILDIKEYNSTDPSTDNTTATKGMKLPRVGLTDKTQLYPMFAGDTDYENNTNNKKETEDKIHTGLMVYNVNPDMCTDLYTGAQVWDGKQWTLLGEGIFPSETDILVDNRNPDKPEKYIIGKFGNGAGWWMLENLRADRWPDGNTSGISKEQPLPNNDPRQRDPLFWYPLNDPNTLNAHPEYGYFYSWYAASGLTQAEISAGAETAEMQGICPNGWHIPTLNEFALLGGAVYLEPCKYAHSNIQSDMGFNMQSQEGTANGKSRSPQEGGFNASLTGRVSYNNLTGETEALDFGARFTIWASDNKDYHATLARSAANLSHKSREVQYIGAAYVDMLPIRCVKDNMQRSTSKAASNVSEKKVTHLPEIQEIDR